MSARTATSPSLAYEVRGKGASRVRGLLVGIAALLLLGAWWPDTFSGGDVLRRVVVPGVAALACAWTGLAFRGPLPCGRWMWLLHLAPLGIALLGAVGAQQEGWLGVARGMAPWCALPALTLIGRRTLIDDAARRTATLVVGLGAFVIAAVVNGDGLMQLAEGASGRAAAVPFGRPGVAGVVLAASVWLALGSSGSSCVKWLVALLFVAGIVLTRSRAAMVALAVSAALAWVLAAQRDARRPRARIALGVVGVTTLLFGLMASGVLPMPGGRSTVDVRFGLARASLALAAERPLTGHGHGRYAEEVLRVRDLKEAQLEVGRRPTHAHNDALHVASEAGWPSALLLLVVIVGWLGVGVRVAMARRDAWAPTASMAALAVAGIAEGVLLDPAGLAMLATAIVLLPSHARLEDERTSLGFRRLAWLAAVPLAIGCFASVRNAQADAAYVRWLRGAEVALQRGDALAMDALAHDELATRGIDRRHDDARIWYQLGVHHAQRGRSLAAQKALRKAIAYDRSMTEARLDLATLYEMDDRIDDARDALTEAARVDPTRFDIRLRLGHLALGREPIPGDPYPPPPVETVLAHYNNARALNPASFSHDVADAKLARWLGDLPRAGAALRRASERAGGAVNALPTEILLESFRLAELEMLNANDGARASEADVVGILALACRRRPSLAALLRREAERS